MRLCSKIVRIGLIVISYRGQNYTIISISPNFQQKKCFRQKKVNFPLVLCSLIRTFATHMTTLILFKEYIWLVETIHKAGKITLAELNRRWLETESLHAEFSSNLRRIQGEFRLNSDDSRSLLQNISVPLKSGRIKY